MVNIFFLNSSINISDERHYKSSVVTGCMQCQKNLLKKVHWRSPSQFFRRQVQICTTQQYKTLEHSDT